MNIHEELSKFKHIKYYDEPHKYFIEEQSLVSGTTFVGLYKKKFDTKGQAKKSAEKKGIPVEEVLADWEYRGDFSRTKGTMLHAYAENYWLNKVFPIDYSKTDERFEQGLMQERLEACIKLFHNFYNDACKSLHPVAMELVVGDKELGLGGMVDCLFWNSKHNEFQIYDYKTNLEINHFSKYREKLLPPVHFLPNCELETYSMQLNLYKFIIEKNANIKIGKMYLVHIHEEQESYNLIECKEYQDIIKLLIEDFKTKQQ